MAERQFSHSGAKILFHKGGSCGLRMSAIDTLEIKQKKKKSIPMQDEDFSMQWIWKQNQIKEQRKLGF